ncbi:hypothetical protein F5Y01DRAFT_311176 [Xylaria sp. FL0043]|nr:hypothetical protein F5Y01DRAFT_311176 [Xylaria sp. FL0043]
MAPPTPLPKYVYKIVPTAPPSPIPAQYPLSELDQKDGFVHLSIATQVSIGSHPFGTLATHVPLTWLVLFVKIPITAGLFFKDSTALWILKIRFKPEFHGATTWEVQGCPHLYGNFGADDVEETKQFSRAEDETWSDAIERQSGFLV